MAGLGFPLWGEGLFLRPQHLQLQTRAGLQADHDVRQLISPAPWGLKALELDRDALQAKRVRLRAVHVVLPDGAEVQAPGRDPLPDERDLDILPDNLAQVLVHIALPAWSEHGDNCAGMHQHERPSRFCMQSMDLPDWLTSGPQAEVSIMRHNLKLLFDGESRDGYITLPMARLLRNNLGVWQFDEEFIAPALRIAAVPALQRRLQRLLEIAGIKSRMLGEHQRERTQGAYEFQAADVTSFWLLHCVNENWPVLRHFAAHPDSAPELLYRSLLRWAGQLTTFSSRWQLADIPVWDPWQPGTCWQQLDDLLRNLLDTVVPQRYISITLKEVKPTLHVGHIDTDRPLEHADWYLSVVTDMPAAQAMDSMPLKFKLGAPDDVEKILNSALPGVRLVVPQRTPSALPVRVGTLYFAIEPQGAIFERMLQARSICLYVPKGFPSLKLTVYAIPR